MKFRTISLSIAALFACSALATAHCGKCEHKEKEGEGEKKEEAGEKKEEAGEKKEEAKFFAFAEAAKEDEKKDEEKKDDAEEEDTAAGKAAKLLAGADCKGGKCNDKKGEEEAEAEAPALV